MSTKSHQSLGYIYYLDLDTVQFLSLSPVADTKPSDKYQVNLRSEEVKLHSLSDTDDFGNTLYHIIPTNVSSELLKNYQLRTWI